MTVNHQWQTRPSPCTFRWLATRSRLRPKDGYSGTDRADGRWALRSRALRNRSARGSSNRQPDLSKTAYWINSVTNVAVMWRNLGLLSRASLAMMVTCLGLGVTGCGPSPEAMDLAANEPPTLEPVEIDEPSDREVPRQLDLVTAARHWVCLYDPTFNYDWHDDVLCRKGTEYIRPYLLPEDDFVTEDEILWAAQVYEDDLNASG